MNKTVRIAKLISFCSIQLVLLITAIGNSSDSNFMSVEQEKFRSQASDSYTYTIYIDPENTNDPNENGSINNPFNSWTDVEWRIGTQYLLKKGTTITTNEIKILKSDILIGSYGQGKSPIIKSLSKYSIIKIIRKGNILIQNIDFIAPNAVASIEFIGNSDNNVIENCRFFESKFGIRINKGNTYLIRYNTFECKITAVSSSAQSNLISYNIFKKNDIGICIEDSKSSTEIYNNVFYGNRKAVHSDYGNLKLYNNIFYLKSANDQAISYNLDKLESDNNIFYPEQEGFIKIKDRSFKNLEEFRLAEKMDINSFSSDPQFIDVYSDNFALKDESPAIDAGKILGLYKDYFGVEVPKGKAVNIGITELNTKDILPGEEESFEEIMDSMKMATAIFNTPSIMYVSEISEIVLLLSCDIIERKLQEHIISFFADNSEIGEITVDQIPNSQTIEAVLGGFGFSIQPRTVTSNEMTFGKPAKWIWDIKAIEKGMQLLTIMINASVLTDDGNIKSTVTSYKKEVWVKVKGEKFIGQFVMDHIEWLIAGFFTIVGFLIGRYKKRQ